MLLSWCCRCLDSCECSCLGVAGVWTFLSVVVFVFGVWIVVSVVVLVFSVWIAVTLVVLVLQVFGQL